MKKGLILIAIVPLLASCNVLSLLEKMSANVQYSSSSSQSSSSSSTSSSTSSSSSSISTSSSTSTSSSSSSLSSKTSSSSSTSSKTSSSSQTSQSSSTKTSSSSSSVTSSSSSTSQSGDLLPCGYVKIDKPTNTPIEIATSNSTSDWYEAEITDDFPSDDWTGIYGNSCSKWESPHYFNPKFYSYNESDTKQYPGGFKFDQKSKGIQTPMFTHTGEKLEIRIGISQVNNASGTTETGKPTAFIYFYNSNGDFLQDKTIDVLEGSITTSTKELKYYVLGAQSISYFEFRLNAKPYKGGQNYNFGLGKVSIHSWPQA